MKRATFFTIFCIVMLLPINANLSTNSGIITVQALPTDFVSVWDTRLTSTGSSTANQIKLPLVSGGSYDFTVDWGDSNSSSIDAYDHADVTHTYGSEGEYTLVITGTLTGWQFNNDGDKLKIIEISQWGNMGLGDTGSYFYGCSKKE